MPSRSVSTEPLRFAAMSAVAAVLALAFAVLCIAPAWSAPAPWHWWRSKIDGRRVCAQTSPGSGWAQDSGPFDGPGCQPKPRVFVLPMR